MFQKILGFSDHGWELWLYLVPEVFGVVELVPLTVTTCYHPSSCLKWLDWNQYTAVAVAYLNGVRAASRMKKSSMWIYMFSHILGKGFDFCKKNVICLLLSMPWLSYLA
jgi:hypothetical protein